MLIESLICILCWVFEETNSLLKFKSLLLSVKILKKMLCFLFQQSIGDIRMESSRTTIGGNLLVEKSLYSKKVSSYNGSLQFLSGEAMKMASGKSAFILGKLCENPGGHNLASPRFRQPCI